MNCCDLRPQCGLLQRAALGFVVNGGCVVVLLLLASITVAQPSSLLEQFPFDAESMMQWRIPNRLNEISGLALTSDGRLLAVNDEAAIVYELDYDNGRIVKAFALGKPVVKGDFEGIAVVDDLIYLTTSAGRVYISAEGADGQRVAFDNYDTGLGAYCEIEGLSEGIGNARLYFLCKKPRANSEWNGLMLFTWDMLERELRPEESFSLPEEQIMQELRVDRLSPSGLALDRKSGNWIIIAARQRALIELSSVGALVSAKNLPLANRHRQAEGIELTDNDRLLISDEGGTHKARLAVYWKSTKDDEND